MALWLLFLKFASSPIGRGVVITLGGAALFFSWLALHDHKVATKATDKLATSINNEDRKDAQKAAAAVAARQAAELAERARQAQINAANTAKLPPLSPLVTAPPRTAVSSHPPVVAGVRVDKPKVRRRKPEPSLLDSIQAAFSGADGPGAR